MRPWKIQDSGSRAQRQARSWRWILTRMAHWHVSVLRVAALFQRRNASTWVTVKCSHYLPSRVGPSQPYIIVPRPYAPLDVVVTLRELTVIPVYLGNSRQREGPRHESKQCADMILSLPADCRKLDDFDIDSTATLPKSQD
ncbi:hypothetical protein LZ31DRAFT_160976 [Colletotrichum somersetense]|nr:hypothetical protein LZ31DRAFT_160976 [Colletotrichum somersetense]